MPLTPEAKKRLAETIRGTAQDPEKGIRARLLRAIHDEADRRYRLSVSIADAGLDEAHRRRRERIEAWVDERARATKPKNKAELKAAKERLLAQAEKEAAATLVNRLVLLRHLEALGLSRPGVVTGGWNSKGYREFREFAPALCADGTTDATEGYATLLQLVFDELAVDLPGVFGDVGLTRLFPVPAATLRDVIERLDAPGLASAWTDDTTLGWVYQYWNDPDREALDAKINGGGKIEPHEIASKTQMFTERYMVEWLLQNSLGLTWLAMCKKRGWTADAERVLPVLDARRAEWRKKREAGEVALDALMPIAGELEEHWKYYVPQPIPDDAVEKAPASVRAIKILDPACGSGHFLVIAFDLLAALYREEARHLGTRVTDREIAESILENNLHGIDIDPRAVQIAAAGLYLKARSLAKAARPKRVNLVAPVLQLGSLPADDPAIVALRKDLRREVGIPEELTARLLTSLAGVDYLGSLLKVDAAVEEAIRTFELEFERSHGQGDLFGGFPTQSAKLTFAEVKASILDKLEQFLAKHSKSEDLGLRLDGEQLASGVRFVRIAKEGVYDIVVGNPPYQGLSKTDAFGYVVTNYPRGKSDLYAAFLERALEFARCGGKSVLLTMRNWMFLKSFASLREWILSGHDLRSIGDFDRGAFDEVPNEVLSVSACVFHKSASADVRSVAIQPTPLFDKSYDRQRTNRKRAAVLAQVGRYDFAASDLAVVEKKPFVYWWSSSFLTEYQVLPKFGLSYPSRAGMATQDNPRYLRMAWEPKASAVIPPQRAGWVPFITGGKGREWIEPVTMVLKWHFAGLEMKVRHEFAYRSVSKYIPSEARYFEMGVAFCTTGAEFSARSHRAPSVFSNVGSTVFAGSQNHYVVCLLNSSRARRLLSDLNPSIHFELSDVARLPLMPLSDTAAIYDALAQAFSVYESQREPSVEFVRPGSSAWNYAQEWAQRAVDRHEGEALPPYNPVLTQPAPVSFVSFLMGVVLGRFSVEGGYILDRAPVTTLPNGILFLSCDGGDSLRRPECNLLLQTWTEHGVAVGGGDDLGTYLRKSFFEFHRRLYENRPIYFPLSSAKESFVAFISIHRWADDTLNVLLADHLVPTKRRLEGELDDLRTARASGNNKGKAERRFAEVQKLLEELNDFIAKVTEIAEKGSPPPDHKTTEREVDARYVMDLDDGVMVNSAALWPLLEPQWKDPKKWWKELATAQGKKDYDWSRLAARYFPTRVRKKCHDDPSLAVAHQCFWELHPAKAYAWELRLQDEIRPDFTIDEPGSNAARAKFLAEHDREAREILAKELKRREKKNAAAAADDDGGVGPLFEQDENAPEESDD
ncbi:BREX-6 system adenine-specific DNA-methyltransferase PglX [Sorangium sp. So ce385]|uniref:BREX-6 system adenine-specific DNA-methyltransferase PglX n=1 Tax=Sorangium sp. So ce385 TaxID=3133308 RepID=UPI003F5AEDF8